MSNLLFIWHITSCVKSIRSISIISSSLMVFFVHFAFFILRVTWKRCVEIELLETLEFFLDRASKWTPVSLILAVQRLEFECARRVPEHPSADQHMVPTLFSTYSCKRCTHLTAAHSVSFCTLLLFKLFDAHFTGTPALQVTAVCQKEVSNP